MRAAKAVEFCSFVSGKGREGERGRSSLISRCCAPRKKIACHMTEYYRLACMPFRFDARALARAFYVPVRRLFFFCVFLFFSFASILPHTMHCIPLLCSLRVVFFVRVLGRLHPLVVGTRLEQRAPGLRGFDFHHGFHGTVLFCLPTRFVGEYSRKYFIA